MPGRLLTQSTLIIPGWAQSRPPDTPVSTPPDSLGYDAAVLRRCSHTLFVLIVLAVVVAGRVDAAGPAEAAAHSGPPVLAGSEPDYPPYCIVTPAGQADGFSVELLRASLKAVGLDVIFRVGPWASLKEDLAAGHLQALPLVGRTPEREAFYDFTFPYLTMHGTIVVRDDTTSIRTPADLKGKQVAVLQGDNAEEYLRRAGLGAVIVPLPSFEIALRELASGQHDAVVIQKLVAFQLMQTTGLRNLKAVGPPLRDFTQSFCFAVRKGDSALLAALNEGLAIVMADGTFRQLHAKWFAALDDLGRSRSRIVVGGDNNYPPYEYVDANGQPAGFNVDLTRAIARQMGLSVEIRLAPWAQIRKGLQKGDIDAVQGMFYSVERSRSFDFSPPHILVNHAIVARQGSPEPPDLQLLAGKSILVMAGDLMDDLAREQGYGTQLVPVASQEEALRLLAAGQHDCALVAKVPALYWIEKNGWRNLRVGERIVVQAEYCYAVPPGKDDLLARLTEGLATVKATGEFRKIQSRWLGPYELSGPGLYLIVKYVLIGVVPLLALLIGSVLWSRSLQRQVASRTLELTREITERQAAQEELRHSQKMEAIALLAAGVAHNFNNILQAISSQLALVKMKLVREDPNMERLERVTAEIRRAARLTEQLVTFSRQQRETSDRLDLSRAVREAGDRVRALVGTGVDLQLSCADAPLWVDINRHQLDLILDNLAANAREAMPEGGALTIIVQPEDTNTRPAPAGDHREFGPSASLTVSDTGLGMDEATRQRAFEPFFSTKGPGSNAATGMGLAIVHGIVTGLNGRIQVESSPGQGSTFRVLLPRVGPGVAPPTPHAAAGDATFQLSDNRRGPGGAGVGPAGTKGGL